MKAAKQFLALAGLFALAGVSQAAVTVTYDDNKHFTDVPFETFDRKEVLTQLSDHFQKLGKFLPPGENLSIEMVDVDLAGRRIPNFRTGQDIRVLSGRADWPRMEVRYVLEQNGQVIKQGDAQLQDMNYQFSSTHYFDSEPLRYEKHMIDEWFDENIAPIRPRRR